MGGTSTLSIIVKLVDEASAAMQGIARNFKNAGGLISQDAVDASNKFAIGMLGATTALGGFIGYGVKVAADLQTAQIGLTTLLGSAEEASKTVNRIKVEAARTPFELVGLTQATQLLASVTHSGDKALNVVLDIGEGLAAMGKGQPELDRIIINLQQVAAIGHASMIDIKQFAYAGIPIFEMLQQQTGLSGEALANFISEGKVSFDMLTGMFDKANDAGGRFFNAYKNQAGSFNQSLSNLKDSFGIFLATTVQTTGIFDMLTSAMTKATTFLNAHKESIADAVKWLGEHKIVVYIVAGAIMGALVPAIWAVAVAFGALMITLAPFMLAGAVVAGVVAGIMWMVQHWDMIKAKIQEVIERFSFLMPLLAPFFPAGAVVVGIVKGILWMVENWNKVTEAIQWVIDKFNALIDVYNRVIAIASKPINFVTNLGSSAKSAASSALSAFMPHFATGGIVTGPTIGLLGEAGPEAIIPLSKMGGMGGTNINVTITGNNINSSMDLRRIASEVSDEIVRTLRLNQKLAI